MTAAPLDAIAILAAQDLQREWVDVPEWGGGVYVRSMSGLALDQYEARLLARRTVDKDGKTLRINLDHTRAELVALTACNEAGDAIFTLEQVEALSKKSGAALNRLVIVAQRLNGLTPQDLEQLAKK